MAASRTINAVIVKSLAIVDADLTVPQLRVMVILSRTPNASLTQVAEDLGVNPSNASRTCDQLVRRGLVEREEDPADRRRLLLTPSPTGRRLLRQVMRRRQKLLGQIVAEMTPADQQTLMTALVAFNAATARTDGWGPAAENGDGLAHWVT